MKKEEINHCAIRVWIDGLTSEEVEQVIMEQLEYPGKNIRTKRLISSGFWKEEYIERRKFVGDD